ncbi:MAG TPA: tyrosine-type recombinase/integrase [Urbifossiella sp.]
MARPKNISPTYRRHRDAARCWANGRWIELGKWNSPESKAEFARIVAELAASPATHITTHAGSITVNQVLAAFWQHAEQHYRHADKTPTSEVKEVRLTLAPVRRLYGHTPAAEFGPRSLAAVRETMVKAGWCRTLINRRVERIRRAFRWAVSQELVPPMVYQGLKALPGLQRGRTEAREAEPVKPVDPAIVEATLPHLGRHLRAMVELQRLTGMRPGEICSMKLVEIDRSAEVWVYRPGHHKTIHRGMTRTIMIGPKGRKVIEDFIAGGTVCDPSGPLFSPMRAREERFAEMRENRKSRVPPSQRDRRKKEPKLLPAAEYTPGTYAHAVRVAAKKANVAHWHPNQLRHLYASEVRKAHGLEAAQVLLGHASAQISQLYAERDMTLAAAVAAKIG